MIYNVQGPNGQIIKVEGPEGASQDEVIAQAQRLSAAPVAPPKPVGPDGTEWMNNYNPADDMSAGQKFLAGAGGAIHGLGRGARQVVSDQKNYADEQFRREAEDKLGGWGTAGNIAGNIAASAPAMLAAPVGVPAAIGLGALEGGVMGALAPTTAEGQRLRNASTGAAFGGALPGVGAGLKSKTFGKLTDKALDYSPLLYKRRLQDRNIAGKKVVDAANEKLKLADIIDLAEHNAYAENTARTYGHSIDSYKAAAEAAEVQRVLGINTAREKALESARAEVANRAGWNSVPTTQKEARKQLENLGKVYGQSLENVNINASGVSDELENSLNIGGMEYKDESTLKSIKKQIDSSLYGDRQMSGETYKTVRARITDLLSDAKGEYRTQLLNTLNTMDNSLEGSISDPAHYAKIIDLRNKYSLGARVASVPIDPKSGMDIFKLQRKLDRVGDRTGTDDYLTEIARNTPKAPVKPAKVSPALPGKPIGDSMPPLPRAKEKFKAEQADWGRLATISGLLHSAAHIGTGGLGGSASIIAAPFAMDLARKGAKNKNASTILDRIARGMYQTSLTD